MSHASCGCLGLLVVAAVWRLWWLMLGLWCLQRLRLLNCRRLLLGRWLGLSLRPLRSLWRLLLLWIDLRAVAGPGLLSFRRLGLRG